jgi:hypothetical protein
VSELEKASREIRSRGGEVMTMLDVRYIPPPSDGRENPAADRTYPDMGVGKPRRFERGGAVNLKGDREMAKSPKKKEKAASGDPATKVLYLNLPFSIAVELEADAEENMRKMSVHAAWIIKRYFDAKKKSK